MITLYGASRVPFTEKVRLALLYKGLDFELVEPVRLEDYKRFSPKTGMLPALDLHGEHVPDSTEILLRLDQVYPEPALLSPDPTVAAQQWARRQRQTEKAIAGIGRMRELPPLGL